jgi:hypothetical protein
VLLSITLDSLIIFLSLCPIGLKVVPWQMVSCGTGFGTNVGLGRKSICPWKMRRSVAVWARISRQSMAIYMSIGRGAVQPFLSAEYQRSGSL